MENVPVVRGQQAGSALTAGIVWIVAGANILRIGVVTWASQSHYGLFRAGRRSSCSCCSSTWFSNAYFTNIRSGSSGKATGTARFRFSMRRGGS